MTNIERSKIFDQHSYFFVCVGCIPYALIFLLHRSNADEMWKNNNYCIWFPSYRSIE